MSARMKHPFKARSLDTPQYKTFETYPAFIKELKRKTGMWFYIPDSDWNIGYRIKKATQKYGDGYNFDTVTLTLADGKIITLARCVGQSLPNPPGWDMLQARGKLTQEHEERMLRLAQLHRLRPQLKRAAA